VMVGPSQPTPFRRVQKFQTREHLFKNCPRCIGGQMLFVMVEYNMNKKMVNSCSSYRSLCNGSYEMLFMIVDDILTKILWNLGGNARQRMDRRK